MVASLSRVAVVEEVRTVFEKRNDAAIYTPYTYQVNKCLKYCSGLSRKFLVIW